MRCPTRIHRITFLATLALAACTGDARTDPATPTLSLDVVSGGRQQATVGQELPHPLVVQVFDSKHRPVKGQLVSFRVLTGGGSMYAGSSLTDADGIAQDYWTMGLRPGPAKVLVRAVDPTTGERRDIATFTALALEVPHYALTRPDSAAVAGFANRRRPPSPEGDADRER